MAVHKLCLPVLLCAPVLLAGCQAKPEGEANPNASTGTAALPISINAAMVALTDTSGDYIFAPGNGDMPKTDHHWSELRNAGYEMMLAGHVIKSPGTGEFDQQWVAEQDWITLADDLTAAGKEAVRLADARSTDQAAWRTVGDQLVQTCLDCHEKFKPETPSQGILHAASKRESLGESIFK